MKDGNDNYTVQLDMFTGNGFFIISQFENLKVSHNQILEILWENIWSSIINNFFKNRLKLTVGAPGVAAAPQVVKKEIFSTKDIQYTSALTNASVKLLLKLSK